MRKLNFLKEKRQAVFTRPELAHGQTYQTIELYEILIVESVFSGPQVSPLIG